MVRKNGFRNIKSFYTMYKHPFKVGDKIKHRQFGEGEISFVDISDYRLPYRVKFSDQRQWCSEESLWLINELTNPMEKQIKLTLEQAQAMYKATPDQAFKDLLLANFTREELERTNRPSFEQISVVRGFYVEDNSKISVAAGGHAIPSNKNVVTEEKYAKAWLAFCQLTQIHKQWIDEWKPESSTPYYGFIRNVRMGKVSIESDQFLLADTDRIFIFPTLEMRDSFYTKFQWLIEEAKYFIH